MNLREALELIAEQCEEHPLYLPDATEADLEREGGDAASVTYWAQTARDALRASPSEAKGEAHPWRHALEETVRIMGEKLEAAERDAERYRWLRNSPNAYPLFFIAQREPGGIVVQFRGELADMNIDEMIASSSRSGGDDK